MSETNGITEGSDAKDL